MARAQANASASEILEPADRVGGVRVGGIRTPGPNATAQGTFVYLAAGSRIDVIDVADPARRGGTI